MKETRLAIIDNSIHPEIYKPVEHWSAYLGRSEWTAFYGPKNQLPSLKGFTHVILTGSEASILDREPWVEREIEFVMDAGHEGLSLLGSCYGHQLLALALAGPTHVGRCREPEIGWIPIDIKTDSSLLGLARSAFTFSAHFDEVRDLGDPFVILASTDVCPIQAFGIRGRNVWGLQIHPEIDITAAGGLLEDFRGVFPKYRPFYEGALASEPSDSGLIFKIINTFLGISWNFCLTKSPFCRIL
jgi:GMP synthase-like glutamine amidotransferase